MVVPLAMGAAFGVTTHLLIHRPVLLPDWARPLTVFLVPGFIAGIVAGGNVHDQNPVVVALGNFLFYFLVTLLILKVHEGLTRSTDERYK